MSVARPAAFWIGAALAGWAAAAVACSQAPAPEIPGPEAPEVETVAPAEPAPVLEPEPAEEADTARKLTEQAPEPGAHGGDATVIPIVEPRGSHPRTPWEAAVAAREQRKQNPRPRISVTDDNLHEFQDAELTFAEPREAAPADAADGAGEGSGEEGETEEVRGEEYWRSTVLDLRLRLRAAVDELAELDGRAAGLRRSFYAEDDPYVRDGEIKPAWDRALDRIDETRRDILRLYRELEDTLEQGSQAGALPGWLREGIELEPEPEELPHASEAIHEPSEPEVMEIEPPPGRP
jgi:hypothetical protein